MSLRRKLDDYAEETYPEGSQIAVKRKRKIDDDSQHEDDAENDANSDNNDDESENANLPSVSMVFDHPVAPLPVGDDGYVEGSIVKMVLRNFVTYDFCEFSPGPQLNMIIGPNGTGKSTIVCAIALGLGGSPLLLGRARNLSDFVKTGEENASIQVELKKVEGRNVVIQRNITKSTNKSTWKLNGRSVTNREIMGIIASLNIQVDNLCQFLPQDKVAEFAQLSPPLLLSRTQTAVGDNDLTECHQALVDKRQKQKELQTSLDTYTKYHNELQTRNQLLEKDINRIKEREKLAKEITLLKATLPLARCAEAKNNYEEAKATVNESLEEKSRLARENRPVLQAQEACEAENERDQNERKKTVAELHALESQLGTIRESIAKSKQDVIAKKATIKDIKKREQRWEEEIKELESKINRLTEQVLVEPSLPGDEIDQEISRIVREISEVSAESQSEMENIRDFSRQRQEKQHQINNKRREINEMQDIRRIRLDNLKRHQTDTFKAFHWYRENKTLFSGKIHGPIQLSLNLKDKRYADQVEAALGGVSSSHLRTFVCENADDYKKFMAEMVDQQGLRLTASWPGNIDIAATMETPCSDEQLKSDYGMDHFLINLLDGPPIVLAYLCQQLHINKYPVTLQRMDVKRIVDQSPYANFAVAGNVYRVKKYRYGRGGSQTAVRTIPPAKILTDTVNRELYSQNMNRLKELEVMASTIDSEIESLNTKRQEYAQRLQELKHKNEDKKALRNDMHNAHRIWEGQKRRLVRYEKELEEKKAAPMSMEEEIEGLQAEILQEAIRRAKLAGKYQKTLELYVEKWIRRNEVSLRLLSSRGKLESMKLLAKSKKLLLDEATRKYEQARTLATNCKNAVRQLVSAANKAGQDLPEELQEEFQQICEKWRTDGLDKTYQEIEDAINGLQAKSDALKMTNPLAITTYEKLMAETKSVNENIASNTEELETISSQITELHNRWEPRLVSLVARISEKFSEAFQRIGCVGDVGIGRDEDYAKWGINIQVKFRDNERLQLLTSQRQSGGERAVSTILYLMSLQNLARAPFRVVDEINQGMDPRNERMIHEQIVKSASLAGTSQYFLITPKLLPDLYYNEHMRVLCIYNGEWQPEKLNSVDHYLQNAKKSMVVA